MPQSLGGSALCTRTVLKTVQDRACLTLRDAKTVDKPNKQAQILKTLNHPNIIRLFDSFEEHSSVHLVLELCSGGDLFDKIQDQSLTEAQVAIVMRQLFAAVSHMHSQGVTHRDLRPETILFATEGPIETTSLKLIHFGGATTNASMTTKMGTPYYIAPEVLVGRRYTRACDLWSCGVILYILLCGCPPFNGETDAQVLHAVRCGVYTFDPAEWEGVSENAKELIRQLLVLNPEKRLTAEEAAEHVWVKTNSVQIETPVPAEAAPKSTLIFNAAGTQTNFG
jgi:calcium-dependent protein kinase